MKRQIHIDLDVLDREGISLGEYLVLLEGYFDVNHREVVEKLSEDDSIGYYVNDPSTVILSSNIIDKVKRVMLKSEPSIKESGIDFSKLAIAVQSLYPRGNKPGTTYSFQGKTKDIELRLLLLYAEYGSFTEEEVITAIRKYVAEMQGKLDKMMLLRNFIIRQTYEGERESLLKSYIENSQTK